MDERKTPLENVTLYRERVCLDFVNTVDWRGSRHPEEHLQNFQDLIRWSQQVDLLSTREAQPLLRQAAERSREAERVFKRAITLRETLYRLFSSVVQGTAPKESDLAVFNKALSKTMAHSCLVQTSTGFAWDSSGEKARLDWMLNPIIRSAADVLVSEELKRLNMCADPKCGWLFWDTSRNHSRRWCDMKDCGNRAKARRFYRRKQQARSS